MTKLVRPHHAHTLSLSHFLLGLRIRILQSTAHPPPLCMASCRHLVSASYRLVFTLISKPDLRSSSSYIAAQVATNSAAQYWMRTNCS